MKAVDFITQGSGFVTLLGYTKYYEDYLKLKSKLTFENWMVLDCGQYRQPHDVEKAKKLRFFKIQTSDMVIVVSDIGTAVSGITRAEIAFAADHRQIPIFYWRGGELMGVTDLAPPHHFQDSKLIDSFAKSYGGLGF